jgi:hypothetical protein
LTEGWGHLAAVAPTVVLVGAPAAAPAPMVRSQEATAATKAVRVMPAAAEATVMVSRPGVEE